MAAEKIVRLTIIALALNVSVLSAANALTLSAKCDVSATRSRISVVGSGGLGGSYWVTVLSGGIAKSSKAKTTNVQGVVSFAFDSNQARIGAGATAIPTTYIQDNFVIARLRDAVTNRLLGAVGPICTVVK